MIKREKYLKKIRPFYNDDLIKVITGVRRSGKSSLLLQIIDELYDNGITKEQIIYIDLDSKKYKNIKSERELEDTIDNLYTDKSIKTYLFIDEIQNINEFEEVINAYRTSFDISIFITGSNSYLLSGELVTKLTGRYIEFSILPFSYQEALQFVNLNYQNISFDIQNYITYGGFPKRFEYTAEEQIYSYIESVTNQIISKDILKKVKIRNKDLLLRLINYICNNPACTFSSESIVKYFKSEHISTKVSTINHYLDFIVNSKMVNRCIRYDIRGKRTLKFEEKYYLSDLSFKTIMNSANNISYSNALENIVYNELISRGYKVFVGKLYGKEIDFVVLKNSNIAYVQVAYIMSEQQTIDREFLPLEATRDNFPKYVISLDPLNMSRNGIKHLRLIEDFLLNDEALN